MMDFVFKIMDFAFKTMNYEQPTAEAETEAVKKVKVPEGVPPKAVEGTEGLEGLEGLDDPMAVIEVSSGLQK